ncbi:DUF305 domain-containing protein [Eoetvoesiella caeni]|uniref:DUF305 family protein family protein n=1 Tax=Eoetvoesiella caeni TaxID=645616 RepID=A0A366H0Y1_9BURK|nr:DUF305 domain-containing protein [Eoetvoesiella caeni]MCI2811323.1 DUF305 domain-containing protein [Eoetvoesiella caeni]RBP33602.1 DUF305 family protein family protein [Eoetvoesiella caeni]
MKIQIGKKVRVARHILLPLMLGASLGATSVLASAQTTTPSNQGSMSSGAMKGNMPMDMRGSMMNMRKQMDAMKSSGDIDHDFAAMMRIHHQGAVDMAELELKKGKDPKMQQMAKDIIAAQNKEIAQFDQWLAQHKKQQK